MNCSCFGMISSAVYALDTHERQLVHRLAVHFEYEPHHARTNTSFKSSGTSANRIQLVKLRLAGIAVWRQPMNWRHPAPSGVSDYVSRDHAAPRQAASSCSWPWTMLPWLKTLWRYTWAHISQHATPERGQNYNNNCNYWCFMYTI